MHNPEKHEAATLVNARTNARTSIAFLAALAVFIFTPGISMSSENIRVAIADDQKTVTLTSPFSLVVEGKRSNKIQHRLIITPAIARTGPVRVTASGAFIQVNGKSFRGKLEVRKNKNGLLLVVNELDLEDYLLGVVASEMPYDWNIETLEAQAIASRTYALYQKRMTDGKVYNLVATENGQMYHGISGERSTAARAVQETRGLVITYEGGLIQAFYHSSCGGHTEDASQLWDVDEPYLKGVDCDCQEISKYGEWERRFSPALIARALGKRKFQVSHITSMALGSITSAGRVQNVSIRHAGGSTLVPAESLRSAVGNSLIPSVFFELELLGDEFVFSGRGMGHGVGLCQWGAEEMARNKHDYRSILSHYYPGTVLARIDDL